VIFYHFSKLDRFWAPGEIEVSACSAQRNNHQPVAAVAGVGAQHCMRRKLDQPVADETA
jgi:hypothetical protein